MGNMNMTKYKRKWYCVLEPNSILIFIVLKVLMAITKRTNERTCIHSQQTTQQTCNFASFLALYVFGLRFFFSFFFCLLYLFLVNWTELNWTFCFSMKIHTFYACAIKFHTRKTNSHIYTHTWTRTQYLSFYLFTKQKQKKRRKEKSFSL